MFLNKNQSIPLQFDLSHSLDISKVSHHRKILVIEIVKAKYRLCIDLPYKHLNSAKKDENMTKKENLMFLTIKDNLFHSNLTSGIILQ